VIALCGGFLQVTIPGCIEFGLIMGLDEINHRELYKHSIGYKNASLKSKNNWLVNT
jgi:hypothetical protein